MSGQHLTVPGPRPERPAITIYGASDDCIEVEGDITEEFDACGKEDGTLTLSDGTVIKHSFFTCWRFEVVTLADGAQVEITKCPEDDDDNYSDRVVIASPIEWVRFDGDGTVASR